MDHCSASDKPPIKSEESEEEHDQLPLKQRLKILRSSNQVSDFWKTEETTALAICSLDIEKGEDGITQHMDSAHFIGERMVKHGPMDKCQFDTPEKCSNHKMEQNTCYFLNQTMVSELNAGFTKEVCSGGKSTENNLSSQRVDCLKEPCSSEVQAIKAKSEAPDYYLDDLDFVNLKERRRMLLLRKSLESTKPVTQHADSAQFIGEGMVENEPMDICQSDRPENCSNHKIEQNTCYSLKQTMVSELNAGFTKEEVCNGSESTENNLSHQRVDCLREACSSEVQATKVKSEAPDYTLDDLDFVNLKERRRMLLLRKSLESTNSVTQDNITGFSTNVVGCLHDALTGKHNVKGYSAKENPANVCKSSTLVCKGLKYDLSNSSMVVHYSSTKPPPPASVHQTQQTKSDRLENFFMATCKNDKMQASQLTSDKYVLHGEKDVLSGEENTVLKSALATSMNVKVEPVENNEVAKNVLDNSLVSNFVGVKSEPIIADACFGDDLDHMMLGERMKLLTSRESVNADLYAEDSRKIVLSSLDCQPISSKSATPRIIKHSKKRKKTATNSVETALEEDAPGLLQVLVDKGVLMDEIKLYGQTEIDEALDESLIDNSFSELESVLSKLFSQRPSLFKVASLKGVKGEKTSYCLACLISLVEQARYLQFKRWPVEWGWCRDLQSFIFVFERHNRIVLERPEYGYATYFFELVNYLTIDWQIKRLVTTMKLTSCSRSALIENKALMVGEDLTQGEARVLAEYGWEPDTGLGAMLNYRDRVVHDRKTELDDSSEWRSKIGEMLMDGYNGGTIVPTSIPQKFVHSRVHNPQIKLET